MPRIILIRHGETEHNRGQITLGQADVPLNALGERQARAIAASFVRPPAAIYSSPLARCRTVADAISLATGVAVIEVRALIEMDVGEMEHLTREELGAKHSDFLRTWLSGEGADARMPGGETLREVQDRAWPALERIAAAHTDADGDVVAVTHSFVIATSVCRAIGLPLANFRRVRAQVASKTTIEIGEHGSALLALNDRSHLTGAGGE
jgi:probable phosphoglycerate mutase